MKTIHYFLEFCYIVRRSVIDERCLKECSAALVNFHKFREVFRKSGVRKDFSLPRQHSLVHFCDVIRYYGAPNGICTSLTESKHKEAVKRPWRRSNHHNALSQILTINERIQKLQAARAYFQNEGMLRSDFCVNSQSMEPSEPSEDTLQFVSFFDDEGEEAGDGVEGNDAQSSHDGDEGLPLKDSFSMEGQEDYESDNDNSILDNPAVMGRVYLAHSPREFDLYAS